MNLKEAFRYQSFLEGNMRRATGAISRANCLTVTKTHHRNKANPDAQDIVEVVEHDSDYVPGDAVVKFMCWAIEERKKLSTAITKTKASLGFDLDAAIEANKFRQRASSAIRTMLMYSKSKSTTQGKDYKFNVEGNQTPYVYDIDVLYEPAYDASLSKQIMRNLISESDAVSADIDRAMVTSVVEYDPLFDVNESFEDIIATFCAHGEAVEAQ